MTLNRDTDHHAPLRVVQFRTIIRKAFCEVKPGFDRARRRISPQVADGQAAFAAMGSNSEIVGLDFLVGAQFVGLAGIDHLALAHDVHIIDELERKVSVLLHQQN